MPILANAKKALRKDQRRTVVNKRVKNRMKTAIKAVINTKLESNLASAYQAVDRAAKNKLIHKKKAARIKSKLSKLILKSSSKSAQPKPVRKPSTKTKK